MAVATSLGELWKALRTALLTDADLVAMLGQADNIWREFPREALPFPLITMESRASNPSALSGPGAFRPTLQIDIFVIDPYNAEAIYRQLQAGWSIPDTRATEVQSTNWRLTQLVFGSLERVGLLRTIDTDEDVTRFSVQATTKVVKKSG